MEDLGGSVIRSQLLFLISFIMHSSVFKVFAVMMGKTSQIVFFIAYTLSRVPVVDLWKLYPH